MVPHEEFLRLWAVASAGELTEKEQAKLEAHLASCTDCRQAIGEYAAVATHAMAGLGADFDPQETELDSGWSVEEAEKRFLKKLEAEEKPPQNEAVRGQRFGYRCSQFSCREFWMSLAAVVLLCIALAITAYRTGIKLGTDVAGSLPRPVEESDTSLEAQASDAGYERAQLLAKINGNTKKIEDLKRQLSEQIRVVNSLKSARSPAHAPASNEVSSHTSASNGDQELAAAQAKLAQLQKAADAAKAQRNESARQAASLEAKVNELTDLLRQKGQALDQSQAEVAKQQELLDHDRDVRELMGARDLYITDVYDVSGKGTEKSYGRVFYARGKRLVFYAFDLDTQPSLQNAKSFQAWGRRGPDKEQARSLGIFYEDNASKKRWVLKADDPKSLEDIDAVFVTIEPNGGSARPSGKQLMFAYLRIDPNYP